MLSNVTYRPTLGNILFYLKCQSIIDNHQKVANIYDDEKD